jgi:hypothetical protein
MNEQNTGVEDPKAVAQKAAELWVENTAVRIKDNPESGARTMLTLHRRIEELEKGQRVTELRLAKPEDLKGKTPVTWSTGPNVLGLRLFAGGLLHNGSKDIIQARILRSKKGTFRVQTLADMYQRGVLMGTCAAEKREPTAKEYDELGRDYCSNGDFTNAVIAFCQPKNLIPALKAAGLEDDVKWFDAVEPPADEPPAESESLPPEPTFDG